METAIPSREQTLIDDQALVQLASRLRGDLLRPGEEGYEETRSIWNAMIDKRPAAIARCLETDDVVKAVNFARQHELLLSVRGSGHNVAGSALVEGGFMIDLSLMKEIQLDSENQTATAQPGVVFGELDQATQPHGLAAPGGIVSETGIAGLTLGGGFGWLSRKYGFTCDNLLSAEVVTADGEVLTASEEQNTDLFWGIRGGGGNFGVVTSFKFQLQPVGPEVLAGMTLYRLEDAAEALHFFRDFTASTPNELGALAVFRLAPPAPFIPEDLHGKPILAIIVCYLGELEQGEQVVKPLREYGDPLVDAIKPKPFAEHNSALDAGQPEGMHYYWKSEYMTEIADGAIDALVEHAGKMTSKYTRLALFQLGGAIQQHDEGSMAVSHRNAEYIAAINTGWDDPADTEDRVSWTKDTWQAIRPFSSGGVYVNFLSEDDGEERVRAAYGGGDKYKRLVELKTKYDPTNLFQMNKNIKPKA